MLYKCKPPSKAELIKVIRRDDADLYAVTRIEEPDELEVFNRAMRQYMELGVTPTVILLGVKRDE